jgi:hypothetical protein
MDWKTENEMKAKALPQEKRQEFLDLMWKGELLGDAAEKCGIHSDVAAAILMMNIENRKFLRTESV